MIVGVGGSYNTLSNANILSGGPIESSVHMSEPQRPSATARKDLGSVDAVDYPGGKKDFQVSCFLTAVPETLALSSRVVTVVQLFLRVT